MDLERVCGKGHSRDHCLVRGRDPGHHHKRVMIERRSCKNTVYTLKVSCEEKTMGAKKVTTSERRVKTLKDTIAATKNGHHSERVQ